MSDGVVRRALHLVGGSDAVSDTAPEAREAADIAPDAALAMPEPTPARALAALFSASLPL